LFIAEKTGSFETEDEMISPLKVMRYTHMTYDRDIITPPVNLPVITPVACILRSFEER
jgi:hypothetical protein